jgi:hypothetical protein
MLTLALALIPFATLRLSAQDAGTQACDCPDVFDLDNRGAEDQAALDFLTPLVNGWSASGSSPSANDANRNQMNSGLQKAINASSSQYANKGIGETAADCTIVKNTAQTACMRDVINHHEQVHVNACLKVIGNRFGTMGDFATEEIAARQAEMKYVLSILRNLRSQCRFTLELRSTIRGTVDVTESKADANVPIESKTDKFVPDGVTGSAQLTYDTRDIGPPKLQGPPKLVDLAKKAGEPCYGTWEGQGTLPIEVTQGLLRRETVPPFGPMFDLWLKIGVSQETHKFKGKKCPKNAPTTGASFWSDMFVRSKHQISPNEIGTEGWNFPPGGAVFAEKTFISNCLPPGGNTTVSLPLLNQSVSLCYEETTMTIRKRP